MGITPLQFKQLQERAAGKRRTASAVLEVTPAGARHQTILGLDPSLRGTGFGIIRMAKPFPETLIHGTISCPTAWNHSRCLVKIAQELRAVLKQHQPTVCIIEGLFFAQNLQTALIMGEARG